MNIEVAELLKSGEFSLLTDEATLGRASVEGCYVCDLLSWAMSSVNEGDAWVTVQGHINVAAVAQLTNAACVIICDGAAVEPDTLTKANAAGIPFLAAKKNAYAVAKIIAAYEK